MTRATKGLNRPAKSELMARPTKDHKRPTKFKFRLYVAGEAQNSTQAVANLTAFCKAYLANRHSIEVVNVFQEPKRALADGILMTPTLVKIEPPPVAGKIVGTLSQTDALLDSLGLKISDT